MQRKITPRSAVRPGGVALGAEEKVESPSKSQAPIVEPLVQTAESMSIDSSIPPGIAGAFGIPAELSKEVEVTLPNGKVVIMREPTVSVSRWQAQIMADLDFKDEKLMADEVVQVLALLYIDEIDGNKTEKPKNRVDREYLEQQLGIPGCHAVKFAYQTHFALSLTTKGFAIVKKR